jgi:hypothetical protein
MKYNILGRTGLKVSGIKEGRKKSKIEGSEFKLQLALWKTAT